MDRHDRVVDVHGAIQRLRTARRAFDSSEWRIKGETLHIREDNLKIAREWLDQEEERLAWATGYEKSAQVRNALTLNKDIGYLKNILYWFNDRSLHDITKEDIKQVYEGLEKGTLRTIYGKQLTPASRNDYYKKMFKGGLFRYLNKDGLAREVILRRFNQEPDVRFFDYDTFLKIVENTRLTSHRLAFWLAYDIGLEGKALLQLRKADFSYHEDKELGWFYRVHIPNEISKKTRTRRDVDVFFNRTNELLKPHLEQLQRDDLVFNFGLRNLEKALTTIVKKHDLRTYSTGEPITLKDFRSSVATYFLQEFYPTGFIKKRLGHSPSSPLIDRYASYLGLDERKQRKQAAQIDLKNYQEQYNKLQEETRALRAQNEQLEQEVQNMREQQDKIIKAIKLNWAMDL